MSENIDILIETVGTKDEGIKRILESIVRKPDDVAAYDDKRFDMGTVLL